MRNLWIVILLILLLVGLGLYFSQHSGVQESGADVTATTTSTILASSTRTRIENTEHRYIAEVDTPSISGHSNAQAFNNLAKIYVDRALEEFARSAAEAGFDIPDTLAGESHTLIARASTDIVADRYVATVFTREYSILGAAHPFEFVETLNYDLEAQHVIELSHMFENVAKALEYVSSQSADQVRASLAQSGSEDSFIYDGIAPEEANFRTYVVGENGLTVHFAEYQVAPYAAGPQEAFLTWAELRPLLTPEFKVLADATID